MQSGRVLCLICFFLIRPVCLLVMFWSFITCVTYYYNCVKLAPLTLVQLDWGHYKCHYILYCATSECFSGVTGRNFTKLEVKIVKLSLQNKFVSEFRKVALFLHKGRRLQAGRYRKMCKNALFCSLKFNRGYETEKARRLFLSTVLCIRLSAPVLRWWVWWFSSLESVEKTKKKKKRSSADTETARCFTSLNILLSHSRSLEVVLNDTLELGVSISMPL